MRDFDFTGSFAQVYDRYLVPMDFAPYARRLAKQVNALAPRRVLETGAGTGVVTRELVRILPSGVAITAADLNEPVLALARANIGEERICWQQADALDLPFPNGEFDVVVCQFSVMFFPDKLNGYHSSQRRSCRILYRTAWSDFVQRQRNGGILAACQPRPKMGIKSEPLRANSLRIRTGNLLPPCRELNWAIREIFTMIRETHSRPLFWHLPTNPIVPTDLENSGEGELGRRPDA
jgi:SAM-dependent methyltransferase